MEAQLARLDKEAEAAGIGTNLRYIVGMFRDYSVTLDEAIKLPTRRDAERLIGFQPESYTICGCYSSFRSDATNRWHQQMQNTASLS